MIEVQRRTQEIRQAVTTIVPLYLRSMQPHPEPRRRDILSGWKDAKKRYPAFAEPITALHEMALHMYAVTNSGNITQPEILQTQLPFHGGEMRVRVILSDILLNRSMSGDKVDEVKLLSQLGEMYCELGVEVHDLPKLSAETVMIRILEGKLRVSPKSQDANPNLAI